MRRLIKLVEVGPRDGLQGIKTKILTPQIKADYINLLIKAGLANIEVGSFVSDSIQQMKSTREVIGLINRRPGVNLMALIGNRRYAEEAAQYPIHTFAVFTSISEAFSEKNNGCDLAKGMFKIKEIINVALITGRNVRGYVSCVFGCPYEGYDPIMSIEKTVKVVTELLSIGCYQVSIADTIGTATPQTIKATILGLLNAGIDLSKIAIHLHDPTGMAKLNLMAAIYLGINTVDCAAGGIGGCPSVPSPSSNIDTLTVVRTLNETKMEHNASYRGVLEASRYIKAQISAKVREDD